MPAQPETKYVAYMSMAKQELEWAGGDQLFSKPKIDLEIPQDGIGGVRLCIPTLSLLICADYYCSSIDTP